MMTRAPDLFELGRQSLQALRDELATNEVYVDAALEVRPGDGLLCHYSFKDRHIYLSVPDPEKSRGKFELLFLRCMISFNSNEEVMRLLELLIPWLIAHETGHHLRHKYDLFSSDLWEEERIASQLAIAFTKRQLTLTQRQELEDSMARAITNLARALESEGKLINADSIPAFVRYIFAHMRCFYSDLMAQETPTIAEFVQTHLKQRDRLCL